MAMNQWLADMYGTSGAQETMDKTAELELFAKLAADNGIDLTQLSPQQVSALYAETFGKTAEEEEGEEGPEHESGESKEKEKGEQEEGDDDEKEAAARYEHEQAKEGAAKFAEADMMGRVMAHAMVHELGQIEKQAGAMDVARAAGTKLKDMAGGAKEHGKKLLSRLGDAAKNPKAQLGAAAGAAGGVGFAAGRASKKKQASALDQLAAEHAIKVANAAGWDPEECAGLLQDAYANGQLDVESTKIAQVEDFNDAVHVRGLEFLETVGYPVNWEEVFGG
jgi:hypothetical protein